MKTKVVASLVLGLSLLTSAYAGQNTFNAKGFKNSQKMCGKMHNKPHMQGILKQLNLSDEQRSSIREIFMQSKQNKLKLSSAFGEKSFDKQKYEDILSQRRQNMIKNQANTMEKVYAVLTDKQKMQYKVLLELKEQKTRKNFDKNRNGRR